VKRTFRSVVVLLALIALPAPGALAGGWAVVELTEPIPAVVAGEPVTVSFRVLQHATHPLAGAHPDITLTHRESGEVTKVLAVATVDDPAVYEATLELAEPGAYKWSISAEPFPFTAMPTLHVLTLADAAVDDAPAAKADGEVVEVEILDASFAAGSLTVAPGATIRWTNTSVVPHQVVWTSLALDDSGILAQGESFEATLTEEGSFAFFCGPHPNMYGVITVSADAPAA
jgi:plastocyanin